MAACAQAGSDCHISLTGARSFVCLVHGSRARDSWVGRLAGLLQVLLLTCRWGGWGAVSGYFPYTQLVSVWPGALLSSDPPASPIFCPAGHQSHHLPALDMGELWPGLWGAPFWALGHCVHTHTTYKAIASGLAGLPVCNDHRLLYVSEHLKVLPEAGVRGVVGQPSDEDLGVGGIFLGSVHLVGCRLPVPAPRLHTPFSQETPKLMHGRQVNCKSRRRLQFPSLSAAAERGEVDSRAAAGCSVTGGYVAGRPCSCTLTTQLPVCFALRATGRAGSSAPGMGGVRLSRCCPLVSRAPAACIPGGSCSQQLDMCTLHPRSLSPGWELWLPAACVLTPRPPHSPVAAHTL